MSLVMVDSMLGRLATWLRLLGLDAPLVAKPPVRLGPGEVLLTRRVKLKGKPGVIFIAHDRLEDQLRQVVDELGIGIDYGMLFTRCVRCNVETLPISREQAVDQVPEHTLHTAESFTRCPECGQVFWPGTHRERARKFIERLMA